jgi:hypothetical protein
MPQQFPRPEEVYDGSVCVATGNQDTPGFESRKELLVRDSGPYLACDQLSAEQQAELTSAVDSLNTNSKWTNGAQDKIRRYQQAASGGGDRRIEPTSDDSGDVSDDEPPIEPLN